jgi:DNA polymerase-3 subunit gamma/tau
MRDGLSLLDQAIAFAGGAPLEREPIEDMLGTAGRQVLYTLLQAVAAGDGAALVQGIASLDARAPDHAALLNDLAAILQRVAVLQVLAEAQSDDDDAELLALVPALAAEDVQLCYQIAVHGRRDLPYAPDPRSGFEMTLLRMLAFRIDEGAAGGSRQRVAPAAATGSGRTDTVTSRAAVPPAPPTVVAAAPPEPPSPAPEADPRTLPWAERIDTLGLGSQARQLARQCAWMGEQDDRIQLRLDAAVRFLIEDDNGENRRRAIEQALSDQLGRPLQVQIEIAAAELAPTPAQLDQQRAQQQQQAREAAIRNDPAVLAFKDQFGAGIRPGSIRPDS